jgi:lysophospholipase L1-like esterase
MVGRKASLSKNFVLLFISLVCAFILGEVAARYIIKAWPFETPKIIIPYLKDKDVNLRWRYPAWKGLNSLGLKNREIGTKPGHRFRILYLGDSLVWSGETSSGELYTQIIERTLNKDFGRGKGDFEVINAGVPGFTTYQELEFLKEYGLDMQPDLVVLGFVFNDVYYKYLSKPEKGKLLGRDPDIQLHRFNTHSLVGRMFARSYLAHRLLYALDVLIKKIRGYKYFPFEYRTDFYLAWKDYGWDETRTLIGEMNDLLKEKNIPLFVVIYPISDQVDDKYLKIDRDYVLYPQKRIRDICNVYNIQFLDLTGPLYENGGTSLFKDYLHLNDRGNDIVAAEVTNYLINNLLIRIKN